ncbi:MAG: hypothetical protein HFI93_01830 [Lachnospiraceae bacterium]|nr:hypothetical protein [Lachnospiraceae bacterium]
MKEVIKDGKFTIRWMDIMKKMMKKVLILAGIFLAAISMFWFMNREAGPTEAVYAVMDSATLPVVSFDFEGQRINLLRGYTRAMDTNYLRDMLTPLSADRRLPLTIETYGTPVEQIGFEVRSLDGERLIEREEDLLFTQEGTEIRIFCELEDLLEKDREYLFCLTLKTDRYEQVRYYTRIRYYEDLPLAEMVAFAKNFSDRTLDKEAAEGLQAYLESDGSADNGTLGHVTIKSSFDQITWGKLAPVRSGNVQVKIHEADETTASVTFSYKVTGNDGADSYQVEEFFLLRKVNGQIYLLVYERDMNQDFEMSEDILSGGIIELGIVGGRDLPLTYQTNKNYAAFVVDGELWEYNNSDNSAVRVFSFKQGNDDGIRTEYGEHDFKIANISENGDIDFLVYGYMNRGPREGQCGLAFYRYNREQNLQTEIFYMESDKPFQLLDAEVSMLSFIGANELLYLVYDNGIYAIDFNGIEPVLITNNLKKGSFAVSADKSRIAWQEEDNVYGSRTVCVMYLEEGKTNRIEAAEGEYVRVLDFIGEDFIYGIAREGDAAASQVLAEECPMYALVIVDEAQNVQARYEQEGVYIAGITVENDRILIRRAVKEADGRYTEIASDSLIQNSEKTEEKETPLSFRTEEVRQRVYRLNFAPSEKVGRSLSITAPKQMIAEEEKTLNLSSGRTSDERYFAYAAGRLNGISYSAADAVASVYDRMGTVVDARQNTIWKRLNLSPKKTLDLGPGEAAAGETDRLRACLTFWLRGEGSEVDAAAELAAGRSPMEILETAFPGRVVNLEGVRASWILYYINGGHPVLALTEGTKAELIMGYDTYNFHIFNPLTGQIYKMARDDALSYYDTHGNIFVTIMD